MSYIVVVLLVAIGLVLTLLAVTLVVLVVQVNQQLRKTSDKVSGAVQTTTVRLQVVRQAVAAFAVVRGLLVAAKAKSKGIRGVHGRKASKKA